MSSGAADDSESAPGLIFPSNHVLIAMGPADDGFRTGLVAALEQAGARRTEAPIDHRYSRTGRYQSVHVEVYVESREEMETLYAVIKAHPGVVYRL
jgi:uncharacterized protein